VGPNEVQHVKAVFVNTPLVKKLGEVGPREVGPGEVGPGEVVVVEAIH